MATDTPPLVPSDIASKLIEEHGPMEFIPGEVCHDDLTKCFDKVTSNYATVSKGKGIVVYKKTLGLKPNLFVYSVITTLVLPPNTRVGLGDHYNPDRPYRYHDDSHKCRAALATVLNNKTQNADIEIPEAVSDHNKSFKYIPGQTVAPETPFYDQGCFSDPSSAYCNPNNYQHFAYPECASGIHFFLEKQKAKNYGYSMNAQ